MMHSKYKWDVFVSHNRVQKPWVRHAADQWRKLGLEVFFDEDSIEPSEDFVAAIDRAMEDSRFIVLMLCSSALESPWVAMETSMFLLDPATDERRLIPVILESVPERQLRLTVRRLQRIDLSNDQQRCTEYHRLLRALGVAKDPLPQPPPWEISSTHGTPSYASATLQGPTPSDDGNNAVYTDQKRIEITVKGEFESFTSAEQDRFLRGIRQLIPLGDLMIVGKRSESIVVTLELSSDDAVRLFQAVCAGKLRQIGVVDARLIDPTEEPATSRPESERADRQRLGTLKDSSKSVWTTAEVARICHVSQQSVIRCFDRGRLKGFREPGTRLRRIPRESLITFLMANETPLDRLDGGKKRVLVVDDEKAILQLFSDLLGRDGRFEVETASTGYEAGILTEKFRPDVILLDFLLPDTNGAAVCRSVRSNPDFEHMKIIAFGGAADPDEIEELKAAGVEELFLQPFDVNQVISRVAEVANVA